MTEQETAKKKRQNRIRIMGLILFALALIAIALCLPCAFRRDVYGEALQRQGVGLMIGSGILLLLFFPVWFMRRMDIDHFLIDEYGAECCKPIRNPELAMNAASEATPVEKT